MLKGTDSGETPVFIADEMDHLDIVKRLLKADALTNNSLVHEPLAALVANHGVGE